MDFEIGNDVCECSVCGHVFYHAWFGRDADIPAIERFPIECPECHNKTVYRMDDMDDEE